MEHLNEYMKRLMDKFASKQPIDFDRIYSKTYWKQFQNRLKDKEKALLTQASKESLAAAVSRGLLSKVESAKLLR